MDVLQGAAFGPADGAIACATVVGEGAVDAEVLDGGVLDVAEEALSVAHKVQGIEAILFVVAAETGNLVALTVELSHEGICGGADGLEVVYPAHVDVGRQHGIGRVAATVDEDGEELQLVGRGELVCAVLDGQHEVGLIELGRDGPGLLGRHVAVLIVLPCRVDLLLHCVVFVIIYQACCRELVDVVEHMEDGPRHVDVGHAAVVHFVKERRELAYERHLLLSGRSAGGFQYQVGELLLQGVRHVGVLGKRIVAAPGEVQDDLCTLCEGSEHVGELLVGFLGRAQVVDMHAAHGQPVAVEASAQVAYADGQRAVGHLRGAVVHVAGGIVGIGASHQCVGHIAVGIVRHIVRVAVEVAVHLVLGLFCGNDILADCHYVVGRAVHVELSGIELRGDVRPGAEEAAERHQVDTVGHLAERLLEAEAALA